MCGQQNLSPGCQSIFRGVPVGRPLTPFSGFPLFETLPVVRCVLWSPDAYTRTPRRSTDRVRLGVARRGAARDVRISQTPAR